MVKPLSSAASRSALDRFLTVRRRARSRGVTVFVVVLVLAMLTGLGLFAARSASLATSASGYERQMTQTHYIVEYGMLAVTAELSTKRGENPIREATMRPATDCLAQANVGNKTCYEFGYKGLEASLPAPSKLLVPYDATQKTPSSLGQADLNATFTIEMTDIGPGPPVPGMDLSSEDKDMKYKEVTLTAIGEVHPKPLDPNVIDTRYTTSASFALARAHLLVLHTGL